MIGNGSDLRETSRLMYIAAAALFAALLIVGELLILLVYRFEAPLAFALGLLVGSGLTVLKITLLTRSIGKIVNVDNPRAAGAAGLHFALRYGLTIAVLAGVLVFNEIFGVIGAVLGLLTLQASAYIANHILKKRYPDAKFERIEPSDEDGDKPPEYEYKSSIIDEIEDSIL